MSQAFSFPKEGRGNSLEHNRDSPGPGVYEIDSGMKVIKEASPEWTFSRLERQRELGEGIPGPGSYDADISKLRAQNASYTMGNRASTAQGMSQSSFARESHPGPGQYDPSPVRGSPSFTMGGKKQDPRPSQVPGPGSYEYQAALLKSQKYGQSAAFGSKSKRQEMALNQSASASNLMGPGAYTPNDTVTKSRVPVFAFGNGQRGISRKDLSPGPGAYNSVNQEFGKDLRQGTISPYRPHTSRVQEIPGPGAYDDKHKTFSGNNTSKRGLASMNAKGERLQSPSKDQLLLPGPGHYEPNSQFTKEKVKDVKFGQNQRSSMVSKEEHLKPGPGAYEVKNMKSARGFKIGEKIQKAITSQNPGPGNYDPNPNYGKQSVRGVKITKAMNATTNSALAHSRSTNQIGPGEYQSIHDFGKTAAKVSIKGRPKEAKPKDIPGPGQYEPDDNLSKERIPAAIISNSNFKRAFDTHKDQMPPPGAYHKQEDFARNAPKFSFRGKNEERIRDLSPGPGAYDANDNLTKNTTVAYKQSQSKRADIVSKQAKEQPGPGMYQYNQKTFGKDIISYSISSKSQILKIDKNPGPGAYDPDHNVVKDSIRNAKIDFGSKRADITSKNARELPGPGTYQANNKTIGKDVPSFSMKSKRSEQKKDDIPGPGSYEAIEALTRSKSPSVRLGTGKRTEIVQKNVIENPGPGSYEFLFKNSGPQYSFLGRKEGKQDDKPGPGTYEPHNEVVKEKVITYKMSSTTRQNLVSREQVEKPGPGHYGSPTRIGDNGPKYTMGGRSQSRQEVSPGPGQYEPVPEVIKDKAVSYKMSMSSRGQIISQSAAQLPGPGQYQDSNQFGQNVKMVSIRGRPQDMKGNEVPGPGSYQPSDQFVKEKVVTHGISKETRKDIVSKELRDLPGPGEYDSPVRLGKDAFSATIKGRPKDMKDQNIPGPGKYEVKDVAVKGKVITYSMPTSARKDIVSKEGRELPGPGIYDQQSHLGKDSKAYTIGGKAKEQLDNRVPGPGSYQPEHSVVKDSTRNTVMLKSSRTEIVSKEARNLPGPGNYPQNHKEFGKDAQSFQIRGRPQERVGNEIPGPGTYEANESLSKERVITYKMGTQERVAEIVNREQMSSPGPGNYQVQSKLGSGPTYTIGGRIESPIKGGPGPGEYDPSDSATKFQSPSIKIADIRNSSSRQQERASELLSAEKMQNPGPGVYDQPSSFGQGFAAQIKGKPKDLKPQDIPGPGTYDAKVEAVKDRIQSAKMTSTSQRALFSSSELQQQKPGPGAYDVKLQTNQVTYTIGSRRETTSRTDVPGPGHYEMQENLTKYQATSVDFSRSPDRDRSGSAGRELEPGPGQYDMRDYGVTKFTSIAYTIPKGEAKDQYPDTPGPGHYKLPSKFADVPSYSMPKKNATEF